ncbi:hypothetical protein AAHZ94_06685 [Streptomyces sp. HSW2009]|uniref:hypothetical protein n=1 Tax=Streptomyces sp. HSW2009 TaxID=3142890 RepID=UPI0032EB81A8
MSNPHRSPEPGENHLAWRRHIPTLTVAAARIKQVSDAWDTATSAFHNQGGQLADTRHGAGPAEAKRNAEAWEHVEAFLDHGPEVLDGVRHAATGSDYVEGPISEDLRRLTGIDTTLTRAGRVRTEWDQVMALMDASLPGSRELYASQAQEIRNADGWRHAKELAHQGPALARVAGFLAGRADPEPSSQAERAQVALKRSGPGSGNHTVSTAAPPTPPASNPAAARRCR